MSELTLSKITVIDAPPNQIGNMLLATFDVDIEGAYIQGCVLLRLANGKLAVKAPSGKTHKGDVVCVRFRKRELQRRIAQLAAQAYQVCTGRSLLQEAAEE